jgi:hypothetical protein
MDDGEYGLEEWLGVFLPLNLDNRYSSHSTSRFSSTSHSPWDATVEKN